MENPSLLFRGKKGLSVLNLYYVTMVSTGAQRYGVRAFATCVIAADSQERAGTLAHAWGRVQGLTNIQSIIALETPVLSGVIAS